jgi:hypothetical protein
MRLRLRMEYRKYCEHCKGVHTVVENSGIWNWKYWMLAHRLGVEA